MKKLDDLASACIRCGFCLEDCPTFKITGDELESPRGRIYLARSAEAGTIAWDAIRPHMDACVGCLACETSCPSGVQYGAILELAREALERERPHLAKRVLLEITTQPVALRGLLEAAKLTRSGRMPKPLSRVVSGSDPEVDLPTPQDEYLPPLGPVAPPIGEVYFLEGCAMGVLHQRVHAATKRLLARVGYQVRDVRQGCCGALHAHAGLLAEATEKAESLMSAMASPLPVIVNSAGCGSTMKRYHELLPEETFSKRVYDASEFLWQAGLADLLASSAGLPGLKVTYQDACHLAHGQGIRDIPRQLIDAVPGVERIAMQEADTCCGSAGTYNVTQPKMARHLLNRKMSFIIETGANIAVTGNPGCHAWIAQGASERGGSLTVLHTMELLEASFIGLAAFGIY